MLSEQSAKSHRNRTSGIANYGSGGGDLITKSAKLPSWQREKGTENDAKRPLLDSNRKVHVEVGSGS